LVDDDYFLRIFRAGRRVGVLACPPVAACMKNLVFIPPPSRLAALRAALPETVQLLQRRCAGQINDGFIEDYVALHWLEWHGGALRLTVTGRNVCSQLKTASPEAEALRA